MPAMELVKNWGGEAEDGGALDLLGGGGFDPMTMAMDGPSTLANKPTAEYQAFRAISKGVFEFMARATPAA